MRRIYLVPGFFGFTSLGSMSYFHGVSDALKQALERREAEAEIIECATQPTGSIRRRADRVLDTIVETGGLEADELHFIGHSTGGLDTRLLVTPGVQLRPEERELEELLGERVASVVTVSTPHHGTPVANFFNTLPGRHVLEILTRAAASGAGRRAIHRVAWALEIFARFDDKLGRTDTFLDVWVDRILSKLTVDEDDPMWTFFRDIASDQGAIIQLTPESMNLFNAAVIDREGVDYGSVVTAAPPPPGEYGTDELLHITRLFFASAFTVLHRLAGRQHRHYPYPEPGDALTPGAIEHLGFDVDERTNDGIVPTLSQIHGRVLDVARADHLDVVGQYDTGEPHSDWVPSGARYDGPAFRRTWGAIADHIVSASRRRRAAATAAPLAAVL